MNTEGEEWSLFPLGLRISNIYQSQIFLKLFFLIEQINIINRTLFNRARREFEYFHFLKDKEVLRRHGNRKLCDEHPHGMHDDAIRKLYRFAEAKELVENVRTNELLLIFYSFISRKGESLYKDINNGKIYSSVGRKYSTGAILPSDGRIVPFLSRAIRPSWRKLHML